MFYVIYLEFWNVYLVFWKFGKIHVMWSKVGGKIWRREGYISRKNSCKLEVIHIMFRLIGRQQDPTWVRRTHHDQTIVLLPEGDVLRAQHLDRLGHGAQLGYQLPGQHQVILMVAVEIVVLDTSSFTRVAGFWYICLLKNTLFAFKSNFIEEPILGCLQR